MAEVKKVPVSKYTIDISLSEDEASKLYTLLGSYTTGVLTDLYKGLGNAGVNTNSGLFVIRAGLIGYK